MKQIKMIMEIAVFIGTLPLLVFVEFSHSKIKSNEQENIPVIKKENTITSNLRDNNMDTCFPVSLNSGVIVIR